MNKNDIFLGELIRQSRREEVPDVVKQRIRSTLQNKTKEFGETKKKPSSLRIWGIVGIAAAALLYGSFILYQVSPAFAQMIQSWFDSSRDWGLQQAARR